jgi:hypothetical protein
MLWLEIPQETRVWRKGTDDAAGAGCGELDAGPRISGWGWRRQARLPPRRASVELGKLN